MEYGLPETTPTELDRSNIQYLPWDKVVQNRFEPVQNWFSDFWPIQNQNQNQMAGGEPEPEPNQNHGSVQLVLVLWTGSEPNFGIPNGLPQWAINEVPEKKKEKKLSPI
ncbi:hypothetical protein BYT27DRAFT_7240562 [Phlegmacium glaucopus]|nr:hypothetical protein BYT27DRAFT_7240562 [Phlegmacium glaucopus]